MDWFKIKTKHVDYDYSHLSPDLFKAWIDSISLCAGMEKMPTQEQLENKIGKDLLIRLTDVLQKLNTPLTDILHKVLQDVEYARNKREHYREYMKTYMEQYRKVNSVNTSNKRQLNGKEVEVEVEVEDKVEVDNKELKVKPAKKHKLTDSEWIEELKKNTAYTHIDIDKELKKIDMWLTTHPKRQKTRSFILNWVNRIEAPLKTTKKENKFDGYETEVR